MQTIEFSSCEISLRLGRFMRAISKIAIGSDAQIHLRRMLRELKDPLEQREWHVLRSGRCCIPLFADEPKRRVYRTNLKVNAQLRVASAAFTSCSRTLQAVRGGCHAN